MIAERIIDFFRGRDDLFFIKIGAHDGVEGDLLPSILNANPNWGGVLVEPVPHLFARLQRNYSDTRRFQVLNAAIDTHSGTRMFYSLPSDPHLLASLELPEWVDQIGSLDREHLVKHLDGALTPLIVANKVRCYSLEDLFALCSVRRVDLLYLDAEGSDYRILSQLDLVRYSPGAIVYEHEHLAEDDRHAAWKFLVEAGYSVDWFEYDTIGIRT